MTCYLRSIAHSLMSNSERRTTLSKVSLLNDCRKCALVNADAREMAPAHWVPSGARQLPRTDKEDNFPLLFLSFLKQGVWPGTW